MGKKFVDIEVDKLTHSIVNRITRESFDTQVLPIQESDFKLFKKDWKFDWLLEYRNRETKVFKLVIEENYDIIQGLISIIYRDNFVMVELVESAQFNIGENKKMYEGVAGNLFAFACKESIENGGGGFVSFTAKTKLVSHYKEMFGAKQIGNSLKMFIDTEEAQFLVKRYYKN